MKPSQHVSRNIRSKFYSCQRKQKSYEIIALKRKKF